MGSSSLLTFVLDADIGALRAEVARLRLDPEAEASSRNDASRALAEAAKRGYIPFVRALLPLNPAEHGGNRALNFAAADGHDAVVDALLTAEGRTYRPTELLDALLVAAGHAREGVVQRLLPLCADPLPARVLSLAAMGGSVPVLELVRARTNPLHPDYFQKKTEPLPLNPPLVEAARNGHVGALRFLLETEHPPQCLAQALTEAAREEHAEASALLAERTAPADRDAAFDGLMKERCWRGADVLSALVSDEAVERVRQKRRRRFAEMPGLHRRFEALALAQSLPGERGPGTRKARL